MPILKRVEYIEIWKCEATLLGVIQKNYQYSKDGEFINKFDSIKSIIEENPSYKWQNIYSVCNGYKKSYMGFIWKKELKI